MNDALWCLLGFVSGSLATLLIGATIMTRDVERSFNTGYDLGKKHGMELK